jgi:tetratricopeptide (TPR) repeat protein
VTGIRWAQTQAGWLLVALVLVVHAGALDSAFQFDDDHSVVGNPHLRSLRQIPAYFVDPNLFSRNPGSAMYRPLLLVTYALNFALGGEAPLGFHLVNLGIHLGVCWLVWRLLLRLGIGAAPAWAGALLFGLHPLSVEPVNYVSSRSESLAALLVLASLLAYIQPGRRCYALSLLSFAAGLLVKSTAAVLPLLLLLWELTRGAGKRVHVRRRQAPFWAAWVVYLAGTRALVREALVDAPVRSWMAQLSTQTKAVVYYAKLMVFPWPSTPEHQFQVSTSAGEWPVLAAAAFLVGGLFLMRRSGAWRRPVAFWLAWIVICLLPTLLVPLNVLVAERRLYLPLVGAVGLLATVLAGQTWPRRRIAVAGVALALLAGRTAAASVPWQSEARLWAEAARQAPLMVRPWLRLAALERQAGRLEQAEAACQRALTLDSTSAPAWNNLGNVRAQRGQVGEAAAAYERALELLPRYAEALANLAGIRVSQGRLDEAAELYARSLAISPLRAEVHNNLGTLNLRRGQFAAARQNLERAAALNPRAAGVQFNLGGAFEGLGQVAAAEAAYRGALDRDSTYTRAWYNLGLLYARTGRRDPAIAALDQFLGQWHGDAQVAAEAARQRQALLAERRP